MPYLDAIAQARCHIRSLWIALACMMLINAILLVSWHRSIQQMTVYIPPSIPHNGLTVKQGQIAKSTVFSFAYYLWQRVNYWQKNGRDDYKKSIETLTPFLTPRFKLQLIQHYNRLLVNGELQERIRLMQGINDGAYNPHAVTYLGHGTWSVHLIMRLTEMMNMNAKVVKDAEMNYVLRIVKAPIDAKHNPWGLAIDGYLKTPYRLKTNI